MNRGAPLTFLLCAVEPSGDALGADLMRALKARAPDIRFVGCGGPLMAREGLTSLFPIEALSVIGPIAGIKVAPRALGYMRRLALCARAERADAAVLIDSWAFSHHAAGCMRRTSPGTKLFKYVAPQVWGSRPGRAKTLARLFDGVLTLFDFETARFSALGLRTKSVGNPTFQAAAARRADPAAFRKAHGLGDAPLLAALPGSRPGEVARHLPVFEETVALLCEQAPDLRVVIPMAPSVAGQVTAAVKNWQSGPLLVEGEGRYGAIAAATAGLVASGTATTEIAIAGVPQVVAYKTGWLTAQIIKLAVTTRYISLVNNAAGEPVLPEYLFENCEAEKIAAGLSPLVRDKRAGAAQVAALQPALAGLGVDGPPAGALAADALLSWVSDHAG